MVTTGADVALRPGDRAPDFALPAATHEGLISLSEYRGRGPVFLALFRGLPRMMRTKEVEEAIEASYVTLARQLGLDVAPGQAWQTVATLDGYRPTEADEDEGARHQAQTTGQFLVNQSGVIRWANVEDAREGPWNRFPTDEEVLEAARAIR
jgi:hypothetical protein